MAFSPSTVPTAADLNAALGPIIQAGVVTVRPIANVVTNFSVKFPRPFAGGPILQLTPLAPVGGTADVKMCATTSGASTTGFTAAIYSATTTKVLIQWMALRMPYTIGAGVPVSASYLNQGLGGLVAISGSVSITPTSANSPKSATVSLGGLGWPNTPLVFTTPVSTSPATILGTGVTETTKTTAKIWLTKSNTSAATVHWVAIG